ncbi:hypothetical protein GWK47_044809 [Chionoecetes opilio]|uniref:Uncharacterized protein n=1 Tax=Chionoecetes opilio TaxID=41210 RepID=A0A8J4YFH2_CHIOP|nr:hypothetical protein GWK47_044809 [Chionoecetes opilio]
MGELVGPGVPPLLKLLFSKFFVRQTQNSLLGEGAAASASRPKRLKITKEVANSSDRVKLTSAEPTTFLWGPPAAQGVLSPVHPSIRRMESVAERGPEEPKDFETKTGARRGSHLFWDGKLLPGSENQISRSLGAMLGHQSVPFKERSSWHPCLAIRYRRSNGQQARRPSDTGKFEGAELEVLSSTPPLQKKGSIWCCTLPKRIRSSVV